MGKLFFRPITKEEKDKENNKKSSPTKAFGKPIPGQVHFVDNKLADGLTNRLYNIRHHLERTTGPGERIVIKLENCRSSTHFEDANF